MLQAGRIEMTTKEEVALGKLLAKEGDATSMTRTEPGEKGPIRVEIDGQAWHVTEAGARKQKV